MPDAILLVTGQWSAQNGLVELNASGQEVLVRDAIAAQYRREITVMFDLLASKATWVQKLKRKALKMKIEADG